MAVHNMNKQFLVLVIILAALVWGGKKSVCVFPAQRNLIALYERSNQSGMIRGISEMVNLLAPKSLVILVQNETKIDRLDKLTVMIHHHNIPTCVYYDLEEYFSLIEENLKKSLEISSLIFCHPEDMLQDITDRRLAHRLSLFIFYWGASQLPATLNHNLLKEPFRVAIITNPRRNIYRIFYNQANPNNRGDLVSVNWFDGNDMTFKRVPLLPPPTEVYKNFQGRIFSIPVIHKPPWHFIVYGNGSANVGDNQNISNSDEVGFEIELERNVTVESDDTYFTVKGGRDHNLMQLIAERMNFSFQYVEPPEKIQGIALGSEDNASFSGALGMLQRREVELYLGDVAVTWERMKAVEFSFFTLADSAAFVTHAPRKLNEALALVRPFQITVWPPVIITILISGPILYIIISTPYRWRHGQDRRARNVAPQRYKRFRQRKPAFYNLRYIEEMSYTRVRAERTKLMRNGQQEEDYPSLDRCIWYTINVYLRQSANIPFDGHLARFFSILLWLCATYVLGDVYSAQLTSQLARPARESPINTLGRLENRMNRDGYELLVERQSAFHAALVNSTGVLQRLYRLTRQRSINDSFLVKSVEEGIRVLQADPKHAVFGGRETLYFNTKRYGANRFQLSEKLYTRYSAVAVQIGCPFLDSLNEVIMRLFEAGIVEKITIAEYEQMFGRQKGGVSHAEETVRSVKPTTNSECETDGTGNKRKSDTNDKLQPMNLRMLQGAFLVLACGHLLGGICLFVERHIGMINRCGSTVHQAWRKLRRVSGKVGRGGSFQMTNSSVST